MWSHIDDDDVVTALNPCLFQKHNEEKYSHRGWKINTVQLGQN